MESDPDDDYLNEALSCFNGLDPAQQTSPARFLEAFLDFWCHDTPRDTVRRDDPDNPRQQIVVAGDMSWGDSPDGYGHRMLNAANYLLLMPLLGIR